MDALLVVDLQKDFMPGGPLAVPGGDEVAPIVNRLMPRFGLIVASQDWHPPDHGSFAVNHPGKEPGDKVHLEGLEQILWPPHCVQGTEGAEFVDDLNTEAFDRVIRKGTDPKYDSYSAFFDNGHQKSTGLQDYLTGRGVKRIFLTGVATDVCVFYTAMDARRLEYPVVVISEAVRGVDLNPGDTERAIEEMIEAGVTFRTTDEV
jgi:nicotinamidase/pyrazinamidase